MSRTALGLLSLALLAGCGGSRTYEPAPPMPVSEALGGKAGMPSAAARGARVELTVTTDKRFAGGRWSSEGRSGALTVARRSPRGPRTRYTLSLPLRRGRSAEVRLDAFLPYLERRWLRVTRAGGRVDVAPLRVPLAPGDRTVHVAPTGDDAGDGSEGSPLRTIAAGVAAAGPRGRVVLADGEYPRFADSEGGRTAPVTIVARTPRRARIAGADLAGASSLRFDGVAFTDLVVLGEKRRPARDITVTNSEATTARRTTCFVMRGGSEDITLAYNRVHECDHGFAGPGPSATSRRIRIVGNRFEHFDFDGIQFTDWSDVVIDANTITDMRDPAGENHADGIQSVGGNRNVRITRNEISDSRHQLILVQDSLSGPSRDVVLASNLLHGAGANALSLISVYGLRVTGNTIWDSAGGIFVGIGNSGQPRRNVVTGNIVSQLYVNPGTRQPARRDNVLGRVNGRTTGGEVVTSRPGFARGYAPRRGGAARNPVAAGSLPATDLFGVPRRRLSVGALD